MRESAEAGALTVHATSGTHAVLLGFDVPPADVPQNFRGFAVERTVLPAGDPEWLPNFLRFAVNDTPDGPWSTRDNPLQAFQWGDYGVLPGQQLRYRVALTTGAPGAVELVDPVATLEIDTEPGDDGRSGIYFNRGIAGSQAYARKFGSGSPLGIPDATTWLSRGLEEALLGFIARAEGPGQALRGAFYEFSFAPVLDALRAAAVRKADVKLVVADPVDGRGWPEDPACSNIKALSAVEGIATRKPFVSVVTARRGTTGIPHNKFLVLLDNGAPKAVWTGSTNITPGAVYGHSNLGHVVEDEAVAARYLAYWEQLQKDPDRATLQAWVDANSPLPAVAADPPFVEPGIHPVFSPHTEVHALERYVELMRHAKQAMFLTMPFGVGKEVEPELAEDRGVARYLMLDKKGDDLKLSQTDPSLAIGVGAFLGEPGGYRQFLQEGLTGLNVHAKFIHTKYLIVDPLTDHPVVVTGSANFSGPSTDENDENMLVISGDERVAHVYLTEFMRLFTHFRFRDAVGAHHAAAKAPGPEDPDVSTPRHLDETQEWLKPFFVPGSSKSRERLFFSGQM
jgi:phosphatidylserine/phosphatidylglycerophosphate/cardiolipin synthase-like enzyme